jgi:carbon monoxide dehydrogenase subunit G
MKITGETLIPAPREAVWQALNDPVVLRQAIPGCESLERTADNEFKATVSSKIGPIAARFNGNVKLSDLDPPNGYTLTGSGNGGAAGTAKGVAKVRLEPAQGGTMLIYDVDAQIAGKLAQIGSRVIEAAAKMLAGQFFDRLGKAVIGDAPQPASVDSAMARGPGAAATIPAWVWGIAAIAVLVALGVIWYAK